MWPVRDTTPPIAPPERVLATLDPAWVRYAPFTLSGLVTIGVFAGFLANLANQARLNLAKVGPVQRARDRPVEHVAGDRPSSSCC